MLVFDDILGKSYFFRSFIDLLEQPGFPSIHVWLQGGKETELTDSEHQSINKGRMLERGGRQIVFF